MNILERTTTEEYDEDGRLTSRTTVEKYSAEPAWIDAMRTLGKSADEIAEDVHKAILRKLLEDEYASLMEKMMKRVKMLWPTKFYDAINEAESNWND